MSRWTICGAIVCRKVIAWHTCSANNFFVAKSICVAVSNYGMWSNYLIKLLWIHTHSKLMLKIKSPKSLPCTSLVSTIMLASPSTVSSRLRILGCCTALLVTRKTVSYMYASKSWDELLECLNLFCCRRHGLRRSTYVWFLQQPVALSTRPCAPRPAFQLMHSKCG